MRCLFLSLVGMVLLCEHMKASNWYDYVVVRGDNDYVTYYDSMSPQKRAPSIISEWCKKFCPDNKMKRNQIFEMSHNDITIYSVRYSGIGFEKYYVLAYNSKSGRLSSSPFVLNGKWSADNESGFDTPILEGKMFEIKENNILVRERVHNGTSYNATLLYCLSYNESLDFNIQYCIEECSLCVTPEMVMDDSFSIKREVTPELQVKCFIETNHRGRRAIGSYSLSDNGEISNIIVTDKRQEEWIVTTSGIAPQVFSKKGSSFYFNISSK